MYVIDSFHCISPFCPRANRSCHSLQKSKSLFFMIKLLFYSQKTRALLKKLMSEFSTLGQGYGAGADRSRGFLARAGAEIFWSVPGSGHSYRKIFAILMIKLRTIQINLKNPQGSQCLSFFTIISTVFS